MALKYPTYLQFDICPNFRSFFFLGPFPYLGEGGGVQILGKHAYIILECSHTVSSINPSCNDLNKTELIQGWVLTKLEKKIMKRDLGSFHLRRFRFYTENRNSCPGLNNCRISIQGRTNEGFYLFPKHIFKGLE